MKYTLIFRLLFLLFFFSAYTLEGQNIKTLRLQPGPEGEDAIISELEAIRNIPYGKDYPGIVLMAWTHSGIHAARRSLLRFDLSAIPRSVKIRTAFLTLYNNPQSSDAHQDGKHSNRSGSNASWIRKVIEPWKESEVTWDNQPAATTANQIAIPRSLDSNQHYTLDVLPLVRDMVSNPDKNFGFMLQLQTEEAYRALVFASSDHPEEARRPKLEISYEDRDFPKPCSTVIFRPDGSAGEDAVINHYNATSNFGTESEFASAAWRAGGTPIHVRSLLRFPLSSLAKGTVVEKATLILYNNPLSHFGLQDGKHGGANASLLQRITSSWEELSVTWNNQPSTTSIGQIEVPQNTRPNENYSIDVTAMIQDMIDNPNENFGFMLRLVQEEPLCGLIFASSDHTDPTLHPELQVCIVPPITEVEGSTNSELSISPNPFSDYLHLRYNLEERASVSITLRDNIGRVVYHKDMGTQENGEYAFSLEPELSGFASGVFLVQIQIGARIIVQNIVKT